MIDRFLKVRKPLCKAMIDINKSIKICERDWQVLENVLYILKPIEMGILALCKRKSTLLSAEGIFEFMFEQLRNNGSIFALKLKDSLERRLNERRQSVVANAIKYLLNPDCLLDEPSINKKDVQKTMKQILSQLYSNRRNIDCMNSQELSKELKVAVTMPSDLMQVQLSRAIVTSTSHTTKQDGFVSLLRKLRYLRLPELNQQIYPYWMKDLPQFLLQV